jgi:hypothetical protein
MESTRDAEAAIFSTPREYRIRDGKVEARDLDKGRAKEEDWTEVSSEQLSTHVLRNTPTARWLERNLGWRRLLRACVGEEPSQLDCVGHDAAYACNEARSIPSSIET